MLKKAILLLVIFTIVSSNETPYQKALSYFILSIGKQIKSYPPNYANYVKNLKVDLELLITSNKKLIIPKCNGIKLCLNNIEDSEFVDESAFSSLENKRNNTLIGANEISLRTYRINKEVYYLFYKSKYNGDIVQQTETIKVRKCKTVIFWTKCENQYVKRPRPLNKKEIEIIEQAAHSALNIEILAKLNKLK